MSAIDSVIALRVLRILTTPFEKMEAFKLGIIDKTGKKIKDPVTEKERESYNMLYRLVIRLKHVLEKIPLENKNFLSYAAAYALIRECVDKDIEPKDIENRLVECILSPEKINDKYMVRIDERFDFRSLWEEGIGGVSAAMPAVTPTSDVPSNTVKNIEGTITGVGKKSKIRYFRRSKFNQK